MENLERTLRTLVGILENFKKQGSKRYKLDTILQKLKEVENLKSAFETFELAPDVDYTQLTSLKTQFQKIYTETKTKLEEQRDLDEFLLLEEQNSNISNVNVTMTEFDINTSLKVVPEFNGNYKDLNSFLKITELIYKTLTDNAKKTFIEFIREVKLGNKVRTAIGILEPIDNFEKLSNELTKIYKNPLTIPEIYSKLSCYTQRNQNVTTFSDHILSLTSELTSLHIAELEGTVTSQRKDDIIRNDQKYSLTVFKSNLNDHLKQAMCLAQPNTLAEAINLAKELERTTSTSGQVMYFSQNNYGQNNNYRGRNNNYRGNNNNYRGNNNRSSNNNFNNTQNFTNSNRGNNNNGNRNRGQYNNNWSGHNNNNSRNGNDLQNNNNYNNNQQNRGNTGNRGQNRGNNNHRGRNRGSNNNNRGQQNRIRVMNEGNEDVPEEGHTNNSQSPGNQN